MEAMQIFWMTEDLVEHLLPMLDLPSTLAIASTTFTFFMHHNSIWSLALINP